MDFILDSVCACDKQCIFHSIAVVVVYDVVIVDDVVVAVIVVARKRL